ncbi:MAG TPA: BTAD domain-containing putative transcriptional regulator [Candidatus Limnocylindrales bacterium]|nr:BTAD domain-containing putative transcriptional regulator [Candidatus Limnocylindrales bacterium]
MADLRVLGPVQMWVAHKQVDLGPAKQQTVLAALLVDAGRPVTTEMLIERVWGEDPPASARSGLYSYITRLRQALRQAGNGTDPCPSLVYVPGGYRLDVERHRVDLHRFLRLVEQAKRPGVSDEQRAAVLDQANRLWRGEALAGLDGEWAARTRDVLAQQRLEVALLWAKSQLRLGRATGVIGPLRELVARHPHVEPLAAMLIEALCRDGRSAEALDQFSSTRDRLIAELGVEPGPELRRLYKAILQGGSEPGPAEPEPAPLPPVPAQLPLDVHGFTCRRRELAELDAVLAPSQEQPTAVPIAALVGTAGVGKTTLAVHWAHRTAERFRDGQLYVNLRGFDPSGSPMAPAEAVRGFLDALGVPPERRPADLAAQVGLYRSLVAGKKILVVLDNAVTVEQVRPLLPGSPGCAALITSRNRLSSLVTTEGVHLLTLDLLNPTQSRQLLAARIGRKRVAAEPLPVNEIIARCAGLPLALAVVAARASEHPSFRLAGLAAQLRDALDAFQDNDPTADLRAVLSWSYRAVGREAASLFRLLALPPGPDIGVAAAASLAGLPEPQVAALLTELARAHLVVEQRPGRYTFHDLLRAYAGELARDAETDTRAALSRVLDHYLHTAVAAARQLNPHREPIEVDPPSPGVVPEPVADHEHALAWFADHHEILLASIRVAAGSGLDRLTWGIAWTMTSHLDLGSHWQDLADTQAIALVAAARLGDRAGQAYAHRILGRAKARLGCYAEAKAQCEQALAMCRRLDDHVGQGHTQLNLAWLLEQQGDYRTALEHARQAHDLYRVAGHRAGQGSALNQLGWYHGKLGNHEKALTHCEQALEMQRETGHRYGQASTWHSLGFAHHHLGHYDEAAACYGHAINLHRATGDRYREAETLVHLGDSHFAADGGAAAARASWQKAVAILDRIGHPDAEQVRAKLDNPSVALGKRLP